ATRKKAVLCAIYPQNGEAESDVSLAELERLADTAGCSVAAIVTQCREKPDRDEGKKLRVPVRQISRTLGPRSVIFRAVRDAS
ncbi:MAG: hypothetical protein II680_11735, partial [Clostridia bacterium]|nr:hypothetical protein [Clostridia bacterium]